MYVSRLRVIIAVDDVTHYLSTRPARSPVAPGLRRITTLPLKTFKSINSSGHLPISIKIVNHTAVQPSRYAIHGSYHTCPP